MEWNRLVESEKRELANIMEMYGVKWKQLGTHNQHLFIYDYKKPERIKEFTTLEKQVESKQDELLLKGIRSDKYKIYGYVRGCLFSGFCYV